MSCPRCSTPLEGLGTYCWTCQAYVVDVEVTPGGPAGGPVGGFPDDRLHPRGLDDRPEHAIRMAIRAALDLFGFVVLDFEQGWRRDGSTRVRKGLADLFVMGHGRCAWIEVKAAKGRLRPEQREFADDCRRCGIEWAVWRSEAEAVAWAEEVRKEVGVA